MSQSDWNALLQARLQADAKETADREWRAVQDAIRERDMPIISGVRLRVVPNFFDDVRPKFIRWEWVANWWNYGPPAREYYGLSPKDWE